jgi:hypothetical protein
VTDLGPDETAAAIAGLAPRLLGHGVAYGDFQRTTATIRVWQDWLPAWVTAAEEHLDVAARAVAAGHDRTAGEAFVRGAIYLHFAKFLSTDDPDRYRAVTEQSVAVLRAGLSRLDRSFVRLEVPFGVDQIVANVRRPTSMGDAGGDQRRPFVVLVPGLDSTKEELSAWEADFLTRGLATVAMDGPGQGEAGFRNPLRFDYEAAVAALLDRLGGRADLGLEPERAGIIGVGMGGYYASRSAAFEPRIKAVGVIGGPYRFGRMPPLVRAKFLFSAGTRDEARAAALAARFSLDGIAERIRQPYLVIHGGRDAVMAPEEMERHAKAAARGEFVLYPTGSTACQSVGHLVRPRLADWLAEQLAA